MAINSDKLTEKEERISELIAILVDRLIPIVSLMHHTFGRDHTVAPPRGIDDILMFGDHVMTLVKGWIDFLKDYAAKHGRIRTEDIDRYTMLPNGVTDKVLGKKFHGRVGREINGIIVISTFKYFRFFIPTNRALPVEMVELLRLMDVDVDKDV